MYIVELDEGVWIADWEGDPGRTLIKDNAKKFGSRGKAKEALTKARLYRKFVMAKIKYN